MDNPRRLVLFDIDGTLLTTNGHGVRAMLEAYTSVWGRDAFGVRYGMSGRTELEISHQLLGLLGFSREEVEAGLPDFWRRYPQALRRHIAPRTTSVFPGVRELVRLIAAEQGLVLGLLTGNCEEAARVKLEVAGLHGFQVGAFGQHHEQRELLPPLAVQAARERLGLEFDGEAVVVIGDTPNDIACGRACGAKTIAVATGRFSVEALASHQPHHLFADLSDCQAVLAAIRD